MPNENFTQADWEMYADMYAELETIAAAYMKEFCSRGEDLSSIGIENGVIEIYTEEYFSGCGTDYHTYYIPLPWLSENDLMDRCRKQREEQKEVERQRQEELKQKRQEDKREERHKKFLELQDEFGGENNQK